MIVFVKRKCAENCLKIVNVKDNLASVNFLEYNSTCSLETGAVETKYIRQLARPMGRAELYCL